MFDTDINSITERFKRLYSSDKPQTMIQVRGIEEYESGLTEKPLREWNFDTELEKYLDFRAEKALAYYGKRRGIGDDLIPSIAPWYGIAEHTAFLGGKVDFSDITSYNHPAINDINEVGTLKLDPENVWIKRVAGGIAYYRKHYSELICPALRGADGPSDIANAVRGNDIFYDVYDFPEKVSELLDFCSGAMRFTFEKQKEACGMINGGYIGGFGIWMPGDSIGHISEDASCMLSADMYRELFLPALKKAVKGYENVMLHTHSLGEKQLPAFTGIDNISVIEISNDPNAPRALDVFRRNENILRNKIVTIAPDKDELFSMRDILSRNRCIIWYYAKTREEAIEAVRFVRSINGC